MCFVYVYNLKENDISVSGIIESGDGSGDSQCTHHHTNRSSKSYRLYVIFMILLSNKVNKYFSLVLSEMTLPTHLPQALSNKSLLFHPRVAEEAQNLLGIRDEILVPQLVHSLVQTSADHMLATIFFIF